MITKWATSIANKLAELSGEDVSADQLEIYIYGLECFLDTFITIVLLFVWGVLSHTLGYTLIWVITFSFVLKATLLYHTHTIQLPIIPLLKCIRRFLAQGITWMIYRWIHILIRTILLICKIRQAVNTAYQSSLFRLCLITDIS